MLAHLEHPTPVGVFHTEVRPSYEDAMANQAEASRKKLGGGGRQRPAPAGRDLGRGVTPTQTGTHMTREIRIRLIQACQAIVGADGVISTSDELRVYECDALTTRHKAMPELVVLPTTTDQVAAIVRLCAAEGCLSFPEARGPACPVRDP